MNFLETNLMTFIEMMIDFRRIICGIILLAYSLRMRMFNKCK